MQYPTFTLHYFSVFLVKYTFKKKIQINLVSNF